MSHELHARRYAIVSGKGGVGKTVIAANLAAALAAMGRRTLVVDADLGLANLDVILGVAPSGTLQDVLAGDRPVEEIILSTRGGFDLLPAGSGTPETTLLTSDLAESVQAVLEKLESRYDAILFDAGAGIGEVVLFFARIADEILLVVTPEPTSLMDAYATVKVLALRFGRNHFELVVNQANPQNPEQAGSLVVDRLQQVISRFLSAKGGEPIRIHLAGFLPSDPAVGRAIARQRLLLENDPSAPVVSHIQRLAVFLASGPQPTIP